MKKYILENITQRLKQKLEKHKLNGKKLETGICNISIFWVGAKRNQWSWALLSLSMLQGYRQKSKQVSPHKTPLLIGQLKDWKGGEYYHWKW